MANKKRKLSRLVILVFVVGFALFCFSVISMVSLFIGSSNLGFGNIAVIPIKGTITTENSDSLFSASGAASTEIIDNIEKADKNPSIKGIIFEINSGGGSAVASDEIVQAIKSAEKPKVAWIREAGASGAYWAASACDYVVANRMSVTGSVGVISSYLEFSGLLDHYNVTYQRLVAGERKDLGTPLRELEEDERQLLQTMIEKIHKIFLDDVAQSRKLTPQQVNEISSGMFYLGVEAKELGLIDELGGKEEAKEAIKKLTGLEEVNLVEYKKRQSLFSSFGTSLLASLLDPSLSSAAGANNKFELN